MNDRRRIFAIVISLFALVAAPHPALAHGRLKSSTPASGAHLSVIPRDLRFDFSEVPDLNFSKIELYGPDNQPVVVGPLAYTAESKRSVVVRIGPTLAPGVYIVRWQLAGDDGHPVRGQFDFVVAPGSMSMGVAPDGQAGPGRPGALQPGSDTLAMHHDPASMPEGNGFGAESVVYVLIRWLQFIALLLVIGTAVFRHFVLAFLRGGDMAESPMLEDAEGRAARLGSLATGALLVTLVVRLIAQSYAMHGASGAWNVTFSVQMIRETFWGKGWLLQLVGVAIAGTGFYLAARRRDARTLGWRLATLGAVLLAFFPAFSGHAIAAPRLRSLAVIADGLHVLGASGWLGSLAVVLVVGLPCAMRLGVTQRGPMVAKLINAFSPTALAGSAIAVSSGVFAAWLHVGRIPNLWGTRYGVTLLVKLGVLGIVALTGFYNWRFVKPRLGSDGATGHLRRSARVEVVVAIVVLLVTAVLVALPTSMDMVM